MKIIIAKSGRVITDKITNNYNGEDYIGCLLSNEMIEIIDEREKKNNILKKKKNNILKKMKQKERYKGIHEAYQSMVLGQDECYCDKCCKKEGNK